MADPKQIHEVRDLVKGLAGNHTVVLSTHILPEVEQTCHRVIIIDHGKIVAVDTPQNLRAQIQGTAQIFVEVDGPVHERELQKATDAARDDWLRGEGFGILRVTGDEILGNLDAAIDRIRLALAR